MSERSFEKLTVIIPCCNEEANLPRFEKEIFQFLESLYSQIEFLCIDDGSTDNTFFLINEFAKKDTHVKCIQHPHNMGLGAALRTGFDHASGDVILTLDADLTFSPTEIPNLVKEYKETIHCVIGSPLRGKLEGVPFIRRLLSTGVNRIYQILFGRPVTAASSIFRLYRTKSIKSLDLKSHGFDINAEILFKLIQKGGNFVEIPSILTTRLGGVSKIRTFNEIINHLKMFIRILRWRFFS